MSTDRMSTAEVPKEAQYVEAVSNSTQKWLHKMLESNGAQKVASFCCGDNYDLITSFEYEGRKYHIALGAGLHWTQEMEVGPLYELQDWLKKAVEAKGARMLGGSSIGSGEADIDIALDDGPTSASGRRGSTTSAP